MAATGGAAASGAAADADVDKRVPVLILSGWLGAGKTTMVEHLLTNSEGKRYGILVNDMAAVNVDASTLSRVVHADQQMIELSNGCVCCTLRPAMAEHLCELACAEPCFDAIIIESSGISEPQQVAEAFDVPPVEDDDDDEEEEEEEDDEEAGTEDDAMGATDDSDEEEDDEEERAKAAQFAATSAKLRQHARLDCTVTVVDSYNFLKDFRQRLDSLKDLGAAAGERDERQLSELLAEQVEFADLIIMNKADLATPAQLGELEALLRTLNPSAKIIKTTKSAIDPATVIGCKAFSMEKARSSAGWLQSLAGKHVPESVEYGITHTIFRARRPFHPARLFDLLFKTGAASAFGGAATGGAASGGGGTAAAPASEVVGGYPAGHPFRGVVRSKGLAWMATGWGSVQKLFWAQAGRVWSFSPGPPWLAAVPREEWEEGAEEAVSKTWTDEPCVGDREQEIVLIGVHMDAPALTAALQAALVTDDEWSTYTAVAAVDGFLEDDDAGDSAAKRSAARARRTKTYKEAAAAMKTPAWAGGWNLEEGHEGGEQRVIGGEGEGGAAGLAAAASSAGKAGAAGTVDTDEPMGRRRRASSSAAAGAPSSSAGRAGGAAAKGSKAKGGR